jgi:hypothetical protein
MHTTVAEHGNEGNEESVRNIGNIDLEPCVLVTSIWNPVCCRVQHIWFMHAAAL